MYVPSSLFVAFRTISLRHSSGQISLLSTSVNICSLLPAGHIVDCWKGWFPLLSSSPVLLGKEREIDDRCGDGQQTAVKSVQHAAMSGQDVSAVLDAQLALQLTLHQITPCAEHHHHQSKSQPYRQTVSRRYPVPASHRGQQGGYASSYASHPGFLGRDAWEEFPWELSVEQAAHQIGTRVIDPYEDKHSQWELPAVSVTVAGSVCQYG